MVTKLSLHQYEYNPAAAARHHVGDALTIPKHISLFFYYRIP